MQTSLENDFYNRRMVDDKFVSAKRDLHENYVLIKNNDIFVTQQKVHFDKQQETNKFLVAK